MLFDLVKCHALLFQYQRKRDGNGNPIANRDDFAYARELFLAITGKTGDQGPSRPGTRWEGYR